ncbi:zinc finger protein 367-like [Limulus polyphemus]|uniref:Zinc finger protein 367-like n=1 Tax=Limulus polyphemus TaxID=6850 RepID=A0ABM1B7X8_LIMPO|nr:zinc finger protein 367-like [Limulus polyphemus]
MAMCNTSSDSSPKRKVSKELASSDLNKMNSPPLKDLRMYPWNWGESASEIQLSPGSGTSYSSEAELLNSSPDDSVGLSTNSSNQKQKESGRRGRPKLDSLTNLILEGSSSKSSIRCNVCNRVFPRGKSLQAHMRTHTGERPYVCKFLNCGKAFAQSGQLKTHQRLHTGEKPFCCSVVGCTSRFTHANRHCSHHPWAVLQREQSTPQQLRTPVPFNDENSCKQEFRNKRYVNGNVHLRQRKFQEELEEASISDDTSVKTIVPEMEVLSNEHKAKLLGALALLELARAPVTQQNSCSVNIESSK